MLRYFVTLKDFVECSALLEVLELIFKRVVKRQAIGFLVVMIGNPFFMSNSGSILSRLLPSDLSAPALKKKKKKSVPGLLMNGLILSRLIFFKSPLQLY